MTGTTIHIPTLETERLVLRAPHLKDLRAYAEFRASDRASTVGGPYPREEAFGALCALVGHWHIRGFGRWIVADKTTDAALGVVGLYYPEDWPEPEIAWSVFADAEGRNIAHEAALAARDYAYRTLGWTTAVSLMRPENTRSVALAKRLGARFEGTREHPIHGTLYLWRHPAPEGTVA